VRRFVLELTDGSLKLTAMPLLRSPDTVATPRTLQADKVVTAVLSGYEIAEPELAALAGHLAAWDRQMSIKPTCGARRLNRGPRDHCTLYKKWPAPKLPRRVPRQC
jgi:hypothetical protein